MNKYKIEITETLQKQIIVKANSHEEAEAMVRKKYYDGEIILDDSNIVDTEIKSLEKVKIKKNLER